MLGQALLTQRMGKTRVIAETGAGQHGVATATACALLGLECVVYMGEEDTRRQALNVARMRLLGAEVIPVTSGSRTLKDAINEAMRDWVTNVDTTHYLLGTVAGPHPFPAMVRDFHRVHRGRGPRADPRAPRAACPTPSRPAWAAAPTRSASSTRSSTTRPSRCTASRPAGDGVETGRHAATDHRRCARACCTARAPTCCRTTTARPSSRTRSRPAWTTPASARSTRGSHDIGRATYRPITDAEAMDAFAVLCRTEGIIPAIESAHALAGALELGRELGPDAVILVNLSGRGDKDVDTAARWFGLDLGATDLMGALAPVFAEAKAEGRAAWSATCPPGSRPSTAASPCSRRWSSAASTSSRSASRTPTR